MSLLRLAWRYLWAQPLTAGLNLLLLSLGLAAISFVMLVSEQIEAGVRRDLAGIDLVVGAKGSPMQIMLAGVFHLDVPTGNIPLATLAARQPAGRSRGSGLAGRYLARLSHRRHDGGLPRSLSSQAGRRARLDAADGGGARC